MPIQMDEVKGILAYGLSLSYDPEILDFKEVRKIHLEDLLEYRVTEGSVKVVLARAKSVRGRRTEMIVVERLYPDTEKQESLVLAGVQVNEGSIPVKVSVLEQPILLLPFKQFFVQKR